MSKINCSIDLNKIDDSKVVNHANGARYYNFDVQEMKEPDQYGKTHTIIEAQTKEERESKLPKNYLGKGKEFVWKSNSGDGEPQAANAAQAQEEDDLPF